MPTMADIEKLARLEHQLHVGLVFHVFSVTAFRGDTDEQGDVNFNPPVKMVLLPSGKDDLCHWTDEWMDPFWNFDFLPGDPLKARWRSCYTFGPTHSLDGTSHEASEVWLPINAVNWVQIGLRKFFHPELRAITPLWAPGNKKEKR